jgi:ribosomal protein S3AE
MIRHVPKVYLRLKRPDGSTKEGFFRQSMLLEDVMRSLGIEGELDIDPNQTIEQLGLKNDDTIVVRMPS